MTASLREPPVHDEPDETVARVKAAVLRKLSDSLGKTPGVAKAHDLLTAAILAARDHVIDAWHKTTQESYATGRKRVYYLSLEFLIGRSLSDTLNNLGLSGPMAQALNELGVDLN